MEDFPSGKEEDILHPHCKNCIKTSRCFMKPITDESCEIISCSQKCGFIFHACKSKEHSLLCANEKVPCINEVYGCPFKLLRHQRAAHLETCPASVIVCTMEWNRWPIPTRERQIHSSHKETSSVESQLGRSSSHKVNSSVESQLGRSSSHKVNSSVESQLDVALALRDQRILNEWQKTAGNIECACPHHPIPVVSMAGAEYLCIETPDSVALHDGSDGEYEGLPEGGQYAFYYVAGNASCGMNSTTTTTTTTTFSCKAECNGEPHILEQVENFDDTQENVVCAKIARKNGYVCEQRENIGEMCTDAEVNDDICEETGTDPMITEPCSTGTDYMDMELDEPNTSDSVQLVDNHRVSDIYSASMDDHVGAAGPLVLVECPPNIPLGLDLTLEYRTRCRAKPQSMYTFVCAQEFRRDQYCMHYKNVHSDIHGGLNGWLEHRCPLAPYGCTYSMTRLYPSSKGARVVHSDILESFGVKLCAQDENSNMKPSYASETLKNGILECLDDCEMDVDANALPKEQLGLCQLPCEILRHIFRFLDPFSLCNVALTCHSFRAICATLLREQGIVVQHWYKEEDGNNWSITHKTWMFSTSFTPILTWGFEENGHMANHMKECPYFERNICPKPFFHMFNEEPSPELRAKLEAKVEGEIQ